MKKIYSTHSFLQKGIFTSFLFFSLFIVDDIFANTATNVSSAFGPAPTSSISNVNNSIPNGTFSVNGTQTISADVASNSASASSNSNSAATTTATSPTKIIVTEKVPGGDCTCIAEGAADNKPADGGSIKPGIGEAACGVPETRKYECTVPQGLAGFQAVFAKIIRYFIYIVLLLGVLGIVGLGMAWAFAGGDDVKMKTTLKHWGVNVLVGLILLFLFSYILMALAPWVFTS